MTTPAGIAFGCETTAIRIPPSPPKYMHLVLNRVVEKCRRIVDLAKILTIFLVFIPQSLYKSSTERPSTR